jgi:hypothetical protein
VSDSRTAASAILRHVAAEIHAGRQVGRMPHIVGRTLMAVLQRLDGDGQRRSDDTAG